MVVRFSHVVDAGVLAFERRGRRARRRTSVWLQRLSRLSASAQRSQGSQPPPGWRMLLGCPMSQPPRKPLFWHALFVISICLCVVHCVLVRTVSHIEVTDVLNLIRQRREQTPSRASKQAVFSFFAGQDSVFVRLASATQVPMLPGDPWLDLSLIHI